MSGFISSTFCVNISTLISTPRSITLNPAPSNIIITRFFPMSCISPLTVPIRIVPLSSISSSFRRGLIISKANFTVLAETSISGTNISFFENFSPITSIPAIRASFIILFRSTPSEIAFLVMSAISLCFALMTPSLIASICSLIIHILLRVCAKIISHFRIPSSDQIFFSNLQTGF